MRLRIEPEVIAAEFEGWEFRTKQAGDFAAVASAGKQVDALRKAAEAAGATVKIVGPKRFVALKGDVNYTFNFTGNWQSATKLGWQLASGPLVSNEQFAAGGATSVRVCTFFHRMLLTRPPMSTGFRLGIVVRYCVRLAPFTQRWSALALAGQLS